MKHIARTLLTFSLLFVLAASLALAQKQDDKTNPARQQPKRDDKVQIGVTEVRLPITVKEKGKFVSGLTERNFEIYEDGKRQRIKKFISPSQLPLNIAILMDTSESVKLKLPFEKDAAEDYVATVMSLRRKDQMLFATFDSDIELHQDFTDAQEPLISAIRKVKAGGYTKMYDAVYRIIEEKMANVPDRDARRIIVVLSDGADTASERSLKEAVELAQRHDVTIFGISTKNFKGVLAGTVESSDDSELRYLCEETGGQVFLPSQKIELFRAFSQVRDDLRQEYVVFYEPENLEKKGKRQIKVKLANGAEGKLFHKKAYAK
jgi:Ca-activated chloride channel homolog